MNTPPAIARRARLLLGTLVEVAADLPSSLEAGFEAAAEVQRRMSRFDAASDIGRFNAMRAGTLQVHPWTAEVLAEAQALFRHSAGLFDASAGSGAWEIEACRLTKLDDAARLDLGGIAKGDAVDRAVAALVAAGATAGWVNAGGDLRAFGNVELPVVLRDESQGGVREFGRLREGAMATSRLARHVTVIAPHCRIADALTKLVSASGRADHPLVVQHGAQAWVH